MPFLEYCLEIYANHGLKPTLAGHIDTKQLGHKDKLFFNCSYGESTLKAELLLEIILLLYDVTVCPYT